MITEFFLLSLVIFKENFLDGLYKDFIRILFTVATARICPLRLEVIIIEEYLLKDIINVKIRYISNVIR